MKWARALGLCCNLLPVVLAAQRDGSAVFIQWAKQNAHPIATAEPGHGLGDLRAVRSPVGRARGGGVGERIHFLNLGRVPREGPMRRWLDQPPQQRIQSFSTEYNQIQSRDGLIFVDRITPSHLATMPRPQ